MHVFRELPRPSRGSRAGRIGMRARASARRPRDRPPQDPPGGRSTAGLERAGSGECREVARDRWVRSPRSGLPTRPAGRPLAGGVLEGPLVLRGDAGHVAVRARTTRRRAGGRGRGLGARRRVRLGDDGGARRVRRSPQSDRAVERRVRRRGQRATPWGTLRIAGPDPGRFARRWNVKDGQRRRPDADLDERVKKSEPKDGRFLERSLARRDTVLSPCGDLEGPFRGGCKCFSAVRGI